MGRKATTRSKMNFQCIRRSYLCRFTSVIVSVAVGIDTVGEKIHFRTIFKIKRTEIDSQVARRPVGDAANIPIVALAACGHDIFAQFAVEHFCLIPYGGDGSDEIGALLFPAVV